MPISAKTRLGPYEIQTPLGIGGMGEVYLARDLRLGRIVAIKVISDRLSQDESARDRFQREARAASALNHPNICTIYDVGEWAGRPFFAMEYVDGDPLSDMLQGTPLDLAELLSLFSKLAGALAAAHQHGIIHRDIKPSNIVVTSYREPKIMDFGLAKLLVPRRTLALAESFLTTWSEPSEMLTAPGAAVGTVAYMSPEQARGEELDTRTDLFSLGLILYEAATGKRAFPGNTAAVIFAELLREDPEPVLKLNPRLPQRLGDIIDKAIEKDRDLRYQNASDLLADLKRLQRELESGITLAAPERGRGVQWLFALGAGMLMIAVLGASLFFPRSRKKLQLQALTANSVENTIVESTLSPDGKMIAFGDRRGIHLELVSTREVRTLPRPASFAREDTWWPVDWFSDGSHLLASSTTETPEGLKSDAWILSELSGAAVKIREGCIPYSVSPDGSLIAFTTGGVTLANEIWIMGSGGQNPRRIENTGNVGAILSALRWSPDGRRIVYRKQVIEDGHIFIESQSLDGGPPVILATAAQHWGDLCYLPNGHILYSAPAANAAGEEMNLWDLAVNGKTGAPSGHPRQLTDWNGFGIENLAVSRDGSRISFDKVNQQTDVYVTQLRGKEVDHPRRLTLDDYNNLPFFWSPDSKFLYFSSHEPGSYQLLRQDINQDQPEFVLANPNSMNPVRMTPDGQSILYIDHSKGAWDFRIAPVSGGPSEQFGLNESVFNVTCASAPAADCVIGTRSKDEKRIVFSQFTLPDRRLHKLFEWTPDPRQGISWTLAPNGLEIAILKNHATTAEIDVYRTTGQLIRQVTVKGFNRLLSIDWAADSKSWFVGAATANGCSLLHVSPDSRVQIISSMRGRGMRTFGIASPDGHYLAFLGWTIARNVFVADWKSSN